MPSHQCHIPSGRNAGTRSPAPTAPGVDSERITASMIKTGRSGSFGMSCKDILQDGPFEITSFHERSEAKISRIRRIITTGTSTGRCHTDDHKAGWPQHDDEPKNQ